MRHYHSIFVGVLLFGSLAATGEPLYVGDKLVLNVYNEPEQGGGRVATIETGDVVEELERVEDFVRVRLADGREGWVGANYMSAQPPAIVRLKELQASPPATDTNTNASADAATAKRLTAEVAKLQKQNAALTAELTELKKKLATPPIQNPAPLPVAEVPSEPEQEPVELVPTVVVQRSYWWAWLLGVIAAGGIGFYAGYQTLGSRVRARFGGVKVY